MAIFHGQKKRKKPSWDELQDIYSITVKEKDYVFHCVGKPRFATLFLIAERLSLPCYHKYVSNFNPQPYTRQEFESHFECAKKLTVDNR